MSDNNTSNTASEVAEATAVVHYVHPDFHLDPRLIEAVAKARDKEVIDPAKFDQPLPYKLRILSSRWYSRHWNAGQVMQFIREKTSVPVPEVLAAISNGPLEIKTFGTRYLPPPGHPNHNRVVYVEPEPYYMIQTVIRDYVGEPLDTLWNRSNAATRRVLRDQIGLELKGYFEQIRNITQEDDHYIGSLERGPLFEETFCIGPPRGPFSTENEFNAALETMYETSLKVTDANRHLLGETVEEMLAPHKHTTTFTHANLRFWNIIVDNDHVTAIIGWQQAGWYPSYWEFVHSPCWIERVFEHDVFQPCVASSKPNPPVVKAIVQFMRIVY